MGTCRNLRKDETLGCRRTPLVAAGDPSAAAPRGRQPCQSRGSPMVGERPEIRRPLPARARLCCGRDPLRTARQFDSACADRLLRPNDEPVRSGAVSYAGSPPRPITGPIAALGVAGRGPDPIRARCTPRPSSGNSDRVPSVPEGGALGRGTVGGSTDRRCLRNTQTEMPVSCWRGAQRWPRQVRRRDGIRIDMGEHVQGR